MIKISKISGGYYIAEISPPHSDRCWKLENPMRLRELIDALEKNGCHPTDIGDVLNEFDPDWLSHL